MCDDVRLYLLITLYTCRLYQHITFLSPFAAHTSLLRIFQAASSCFLDSPLFDKLYWRHYGLNVSSDSRGLYSACLDRNHRVCWSFMINLSFLCSLLGVMLFLLKLEVFAAILISSGWPEIAVDLFRLFANAAITIANKCAAQTSLESCRMVWLHVMNITNIVHHKAMVAAAFSSWVHLGRPFPSCWKLLINHIYRQKKSIKSVNRISHHRSVAQFSLHCPGYQSLLSLRVRVTAMSEIQDRNTSTCHSASW